jgi:hypothetical protein
LENETTRQGLRSFQRSSARQSWPQGAKVLARVEVHEDGSIAVGLTRSGGDVGPTLPLGEVSVDDFPRVGLDLLSLLILAQAELGVSSYYVARIGVEPVVQVFREEAGSGLVPFDESRRVHHYEPVDGLVLTGDGPDDTVASGVQLVNDAINQAGYDKELTPGRLLRKYQALTE